MQEIELVTPYHKRTKRDYLARMVDSKVECMEKAREYGKDYWDGDRRYGYGGYKYDGRWKPLAEQIIQRYELTNDSSVLDVGCGKAHLLYEIQQLLPGAYLRGFDISEHGINDAPESIRPHLRIGRAQDPWPKFAVRHFSLVLSMGCLHNLELHELADALPRFGQNGFQSYIWVESYRNAAELFNLECWALTCKAFYSRDEWQWMLKHFEYFGDREYIYFE